MSIKSSEKSIGRMLNPDIRGQEEFSKEEMSKLTLEEWVSVKEANQS